MVCSFERNRSMSHSFRIKESIAVCFCASALITLLAPCSGVRDPGHRSRGPRGRTSDVPATHTQFFSFAICAFVQKCFCQRSVCSRFGPSKESPPQSTLHLLVLKEKHFDMDVSTKEHRTWRRRERVRDDLRDPLVEVEGGAGHERLLVVVLLGAELLLQGIHRRRVRTALQGKEEEWRVLKAVTFSQVSSFVSNEVNNGRVRLSRHLV